METQHTPGPWYEAGTGDHQGLIISEANASVAVTYDKKDARLIAAAPDLLNAAKLALDLIKATWAYEHGNKQVGEAWGALESAIAKQTK